MRRTGIDSEDTFFSQGNQARRLCLSSLEIKRTPIPKAGNTAIKKNQIGASSISLLRRAVPIATITTSAATPDKRSSNTLRNALPFGVPLRQTCQTRTASPPTDVGKTWLKNAPTKIEDRANLRLSGSLSSLITICHRRPLTIVIRSIQPRQLIAEVGRISPRFC